MATSGWQSEQTIYTHNANVRLIANVRIDGIIHSGNSLRVWGMAAVGARGNNGYYVYYTNGIQAQIGNGGFGTIVGGGQQVKVGAGDYHMSFDITVNVAATATSYNLGSTFKACSNSSCTSTYWASSPSWTIYFDQGATAPATPTVSISEVYDTGAKFNVSISSYGQPSGEANRYVEAAILGQNTYGGKYRYNTSKGVTSASLVVNNTSGTNSSNPLTIVPNTHYWYGGYATNTIMAKSTVSGDFVTLPAYITSLEASDLGHGNIVIAVNHGTEGSDSGVNTEYSLNYGPWQIAADTFSLHIAESTVIQVRRTNGTGSTPTATLTVAPFISTKLYGSVDGRAEQITKLYGSVNGESKLIKKMYGSVDGVSKLIYEDLA